MRLSGGVQVAYIIPIAVLTVLMAAPLHADLVDVTFTGTVDFNQIGSAPLSNVNAGDASELTFTVDSTVFTDSGSFPTRGYDIDQSSFALSFGGGATVVGLESPFPAGFTPFFVLRDNDPAVDGFFTSTSVDFPLGVPLDSTGLFGQFLNNTLVTYTGLTLSSLNVLDAVGTYDFTDLTVFNWTIDDGPFNDMGIQFEELTIARATTVPEPATLTLLLGGLGVMGVTTLRNRFKG